jgi:hypothetical protein
MDYYSTQYTDQRNYRRESNSSNLSANSAAPSLNQRPRQAGDTLSSSRNMRDFSGPPSRSGSPPLTPPHAPFNQLRPTSTISTSSKDGALSVNYLPSKFSRLAGDGVHRRKGKGPTKIGGARGAFRSNEARMPSEHDEDYDGVDLTRRKSGKLRWNGFKWCLFVANLILTVYTMGALVVCLLTWFNVWVHADILRVGNVPELVLSTIAASFGLLTAMLGWAGLLLNNRAFLAVYTLFLWFTFALLVTPGYVTYKQYAFNLEGKINAQWSQHLGPDGRLRIQNELMCCGYFSPYVEATVSQSCYSRSQLPGCKGPYLRFERVVLKRWYILAFSLVPIHIGIIVTALLCSNHVTYRFGKGMMPKAYRLNMGTMAVIMDNYASQLAEQYGDDVASDILNRSRSNLHLDSHSGKTKDGYKTLGGYDSLGGRR